MLTMSPATIVILLLVVGVACGLGGYIFAQARQRRAGGGKSAAELNVELSNYKDNVTEHFQQTAGLLQDMTEQYRAVYEHMAQGAQELCDHEQAKAQIASLGAGLSPSAINSEPAVADDDEVSDDPDPTDSATTTAEVSQESIERSESISTNDQSEPSTDAAPEEPLEAQSKDAQESASDKVAAEVSEDATTKPKDGEIASV